jgi:hypothetical protein
MLRSPKIIFIAICLLSSIDSAFACDLCAIYSARGALNNSPGTLRLNVTERYTRYEGTANNFRPLSEAYANEQSLNSSITQIAASYQFAKDANVELNVPFIYRDYKRIDRGRKREGEEYGFGDTSLLLRYAALKQQFLDTRLGLEVYAGIKLPTGDDDRLSEEQDEVDDLNLNNFLHGVPNGSLVDGADLALGSGSFDFPIGASFHLEDGRFFIATDLQLHLRTKGGYDFQYGNSLFFTLKPGAYLLLEHNYALSLSASLSGDFKDKDQLGGRTLADSDENLLFLGPELRLNAFEKVSAFFAIEFAIADDNEELGVQPKRRLFVGFSYKI